MITSSSVYMEMPVDAARLRTGKSAQISIYWQESRKVFAGRVKNEGKVSS
jgi:hypothetical protein